MKNWSGLWFNVNIFTEYRNVQANASKCLFMIAKCWRILRRFPICGLYRKSLMENLCHFVATNTVINKFLFVVVKLSHMFKMPFRGNLYTIIIRD